MNSSPTPCLWFDNTASEAAKFYCTVFKNSTITYEDAMVVKFQVNGQHFIALNGDATYSFSPAVSFVITCDTQEEIDSYWQMLCEDGGKEGRCGWLTDKFGVSWQIVPTILSKLLADKNIAPKVIQTMLKMNKFSIEELESVHELIEKS
ncbi:MAG: VOC family protein [Bacilli bacterium]